MAVTLQSCTNIDESAPDFVKNRDDYAYLNDDYVYSDGTSPASKSFYATSILPSGSTELKSSIPGEIKYIENIKFAYFDMEFTEFRDGDRMNEKEKKELYIKMFHLWANSKPFDFVPVSVKDLIETEKIRKKYFIHGNSPQDLIVEFILSKETNMEISFGMYKIMDKEGYELIVRLFQSNCKMQLIGSRVISRDDYNRIKKIIFNTVKGQSIELSPSNDSPD